MGVERAWEHGRWRDGELGGEGWVEEGLASFGVGFEFGDLSEVGSWSVVGLGMGRVGF